MKIEKIEKSQGGNAGQQVVGLVGSPRKSGSTAWAVQEILKGARKQGKQANIFQCGEIEIFPCQGCNGCKQGDRGCVLNDDMKEIYQAIEEADTVIFGVPIYMGQMSGQGKILVDRLYAQFSPRFSPYHKESKGKKRLILLFTQGNPDTGKFQRYIEYTKEMFELLEFEVQEVLVIGGTRSEEAREQEGLGLKLQELGENLR